jgi:hypothetical protein
VPLNDLLIATMIWIGLNALPVAFISLALVRERPRSQPAQGRRARMHPSVG